MNLRLYAISLVFIFISCGTKKARLTSSHMEGTIKAGEVIKYSSAETIDRNQIIVFKNKKNGETWVSRAIGIPGDIIELKQSQLYVNGEKANNPKLLKHAYLITTNGTLNKKKLEDLEGKQLGSNLFQFYLTNEQKDILSKNPVVVDIKQQQETRYNSEIFNNDTLKNWNKDNFGPITIGNKAENLYFLLGDNRDNSYDSRYLGLISDNEIIGVVASMD